MFNNKKTTFFEQPDFGNEKKLIKVVFEVLLFVDQKQGP